MIEEVFKTLASYASFIPFIGGMLVFRRAQKDIRYLTILLGIACITEVTSKALAIRDIPNLFLFHLYPVAEFILLLAIYNQHFLAVSAKRALFITGVCFLSFAGINTLFIQRINEFNTYGRGLESLFLVCISVIYLLMKIRTAAHPAGRDQPMFWINTAVLMYFSLNLVFFLMSNFLWKNFSKAFNNFLWDIHALLSFVQYVLFTIAIYSEWKSKKSPVLS